jgi:hypothetical protein
MPSKNPEEDPILRAELDRALAPYKKLVPPKMLEVMRENLRHALTEHPVGKALVDRVRQVERKPPTTTGEALKPEAEAESTPMTKPPSRDKPRGRR